MSDRVCLDVRTNDKSGRALNPSLSVTETRRERERVERYRVILHRSGTLEVHGALKDPHSN